METSPPVRRSLLQQDTRILIGVIADAETTIGFLLAGVGETDGNSCNFMIVTEETSASEVEKFFLTLYNRKNIGVILISSDILKSLTTVLSRTTKMLPIILELPTKTPDSNRSQI